MTDNDVMSYALYPKVAKDFFKFRSQYGPVDKLETRYILPILSLNQYNVILSLLFDNSSETAKPIELKFLDGSLLVLNNLDPDNSLRKKTAYDIIATYTSSYWRIQLFDNAIKWGNIYNILLRHFLVGPELGEEFDVTIEKGKTLTIKTLTPGIGVSTNN